MSRLLLIVSFTLCLLTGAASAQDTTATDQLLARLAQISAMQGAFQQRQFDGDGEILIESSGHFKLLRPFYFSWEISSPDRQLIVANAEYLWHYDIDLQTATRRPVVGSIEASPLQILGGDESVLREQYAVTDRKSTRLNSSHDQISYAVFCLKKKMKITTKSSLKRGLLSVIIINTRTIFIRKS